MGLTDRGSPLKNDIIFLDKVKVKIIFNEFLKIIRA